MSYLSNILRIIFNRWSIYLLCFIFFLFAPVPLSAAEREKDKDRQEQHFVHFTYNPSIAQTATKGGSHEDPHEHKAPTADQIMAGQANLKRTLAGMKGRPLTVGDTLKVYSSTGEAGFHAVHGLHGEGGEITPEISRQLGLGRQQFHEEVLLELAKRVEPKTKGLGINDFGSGADPAKINAKGDIDFTLYAKSIGVEAAWLVEQYNSLFRELAKQRYGADVTPAQMDIVAHRYDATVPDWRAREGIAEFELKLRTGTTLLKANPEAYFLEGAYLQQIMNRSVKPGKKTFTWYTPDSSEPNGIKIIRVNAAQVPQFFYVPKARKALGFGGAVGNYHFHHAHANDFSARTKYILRSLDNGPGLLVTGKRGDYMDIGSVTDVTEGRQDPAGKQERRQIIEDIYDAPQMRLSKGLRDDIFEIYEICRKTRIAKDKRITLSDEQLYGDYMNSIKRESLVKMKDAEALAVAKQSYKTISEFVLAANVLRTVKMRARDWLRPHTLKERVSYEDENGNLVSVVAKKADLQKLQFAAFREMHDSIEVLQRDNKQHVIDRLKEENPALKRDIEIIENIIKKKREMMLAPEKAKPEEMMDFRQKAAKAVLDSWEQFGKAATDSPLWARALKNAQDAWASGQALESYLYSNLTKAVIYSGGKKYGPVLEQMRQATEDTNKRLMDPAWMTRISRANSVVHVLTLYVQEGAWNEKVIKEAVIEGLSHFPLIGMPIDFYRGTLPGLLNYQGDLKGLVKVTAGSGLGQIVMSQFIPGYGPVILVVNTSKGLVNLGGTVLFTPLKDQRIKLAYQGYFDPVDIKPGSPLYESLLKQTGTEGVRNAIAWWMDSTGRKDRIYSPRPSVLHPIDPEMKMSVEERRKAVLAYFQPQILALFKQRWGGAADIKSQPLHYSDIESEFLPKVMYKHAHEWWEGKGKFAAYDSLAVKRMMDEYYSEEMKNKLTTLLIADYVAGKGELVKSENEQFESLKKIMAAAAGYDQSYAKTYDADYPAISEAHGNAAMQIMGEEQEEAGVIQPRIEIFSSPKVILGKSADGGKSTIIEKINIRAKVEASNTAAHPAPFDIRFKIKSGDATKNLSERNPFSMKIAPGHVPESVTVTVMAYDANNRIMAEHDVVIPILEKQASSSYDGGESLTEVFDRLEALAQKAEDMSREAANNAGKATGTLNKASQALAALTKLKDAVKERLPEAERKQRRTVSLVDSLEKEAASAQGHVKDLNLAVSQAQALSREICNLMKELETKASRRSQILSDIQSRRRTLSSVLSAGRNHLSAYVASVQKIKKGLGEIETNQNEIRRLIDFSRDRLDEAPVLDRLIEADIAVTAAKDNASTIKDIITDADIEYEKGKSFIAQRSAAERQKLHSRLDGLMNRIRKADQTAANITSPLEGRVEKTNKTLQAMSGEIAKVNAKIDAVLKAVQESRTAASNLAQKSRVLEAGRDKVEDDLSELETAGLDADVCSEAAQTAVPAADRRQVKNDNKCDEITKVLNDARQRGDSRNYGRFLEYYQDCPQYERAQAIYGNMLQTDRRCDEITGKLNDAQRRGDVRTYQSLLNSYRDCNQYDQAVANYNAMVQRSNDRFCSDLVRRLNDAQSRGDISAYGSLLGDAANCPFYDDARNIYNGMKNRRNTAALNAFVSGMAQALNQQNRNRSNPPAYVPPRPSPPPRTSTSTGGGTTSSGGGGGGGMSKADCEKKFCPVCATGGSVDLLGVSVNQQCTDCRKKYKTKIEDCMRGGVSVNRPDTGMSQFRNYRVIKCRTPVKDYRGKIIRYNEFYEFAGQNRRQPPNSSCAALSTGTWEECMEKAGQLNSRYNTGHRVLP